MNEPSKKTANGAFREERSLLSPAHFPSVFLYASAVPYTSIFSLQPGVKPVNNGLIMAGWMDASLLKQYMMLIVVMCLWGLKQSRLVPEILALRGEKPVETFNGYWNAFCLVSKIAPAKTPRPHPPFLTETLFLPESLLLFFARYPENLISFRRFKPSFSETCS